MQQVALASNVAIDVQAILVRPQCVRTCQHVSACVSMCQHVMNFCPLFPFLWFCFPHATASFFTLRWLAQT